MFRKSLHLGKYSCLQHAALRCFGQPAYQTHPHLVQSGEVTPGLTKHDYFQRRQNLMAKIAARSHKTPHPQEHIVIIPSAAKSYMTHDIPYPFRQNTDFLYFSGFLEPNSVLLIQGTAASLPDHKSTLFVPKKDPHKELWDGPRSGIQGALELTGVDSAFNTEDLPNYLQCYLRDNKSCALWYDYKKPVHMEFHQRCLANFMKENKFGYIETLKTMIQQLRLIKSPAEVKLMQKSCDIASKAFVEVMKSSYPGVNESRLFAKMEYECKVHGADFLAYPPVVAGGNRANTIHYVSNNQLVMDGEMVLMDAGCEYHGYTSDITRTWPVSGEFTAVQREVYEALLEVQEYCITRCVPGNITIEGLFSEMLMYLGRQLQRLGIISVDHDNMQMQRAAREFCPHHVSHYLGMDVHDTDEMSRSSKLREGMCLTIEPGLYVPQTRQDVPHEFRGLGIRIEDDILVTDNVAHVLSSACPKHPNELELACVS